jgi:hypothetical protein
VRQHIGLDVRDAILVALLAAALVLAAVLIDGNWLNIAGAVATVLGLGIAVGQIRLARDQIDHAVSVAQATQEAVSVTRDKLAKALLIEVIGELKQTDRHLHAAISDEQSAGDVGQHLAAWRDGAYDAMALIDGFKGLPRGLRNSLIETGKGAAELRDSLAPDPGARRSQTAQIRAEISGACGLLSAATMKLKLDMGEDRA